jgi:hypothetical protein
LNLSWRKDSPVTLGFKHLPMRVLLATLCLVAACAAGAHAAQTSVKAAVFGFRLVDTSAFSTPATNKAEQARLAMLDSLLLERLRAAGYQLVSTAPLATQIKEQDMLNCATCAPDFAHQLGADVSVTGWVQKVSNLILNVNLVIRDARTDKLLRAGSVSIRSNTDESWTRGLNYLLAERILPAGKDIPQ